MMVSVFVTIAIMVMVLMFVTFAVMVMVIMFVTFAVEVFTSWGIETSKKYTKEQIADCLSKLGDEEKYGIILRAKGIVASDGASFIHFDYVPGEPDVREGAAAITGRLCVIGSKLNEEALNKLFE